MSFHRLLLSAALFLPAAPVFANCEVGAYWIHTLAEYKPYEAERTLLPYWKESETQLGLEGNGLDRGPEPLAALEHPKLRLVHASESCSGATFRQRERYVDPHEYLLEAPQCRALLEDVPSRGYILLDATRQELRFADASPIGSAALSPEDRGALEAEIGTRVPGLELYAGSLPWADFAETRIQPADVVASHVETTTVGFGVRPFVMAVAVLTLRNLDRLYPAIEWDPKLGDKLRGHTIEYPVIFFRDSHGRLRYVGDGSSCAVYPVASAASQPRLPLQLGAVERFRLTGAFDMNADGAPDILEVNDRFAYLLEPDGRVLVIRVGLGC